MAGQAMIGGRSRRSAARRWPLLVALTSAGTLAACGAPRPVAMPPAPPAVAAVPATTDGHTSPDLLLLQPADLAGWARDGTAGDQNHPGPGVASATTRYIRGRGAQTQRLYNRVSVFASAGAALAEFKQEQGDIGRSSTLAATDGTPVGQNELTYTVDSGVGAAATTSAGVLIQERNYLLNIVLSAPHGATPGSDLAPLAKRAAAKVANAP